MVTERLRRHVVLFLIAGIIVFLIAIIAHRRASVPMSPPTPTEPVRAGEVFRADVEVVPASR